MACGIDAGLRLGDLLWAGHANLQVVNACSFFPRERFSTLALPLNIKHKGGRSRRLSLLLMGGGQSGKFLNDIWRLDVSALRKHSRCLCVSAHTDGELDSHGRRILRKWKGRGDFGCCGAGKGWTIIYIAAGSTQYGGTKKNRDVWASENGGATWLCMTQSAPWQPRALPSMAAVPGKPDHVVFAGGMVGIDEFLNDVWTSNDAGSTWSKVHERIGNIFGRCQPGICCIPQHYSKHSLTQKDHEVFLIFGGTAMIPKPWWTTGTRDGFFDWVNWQDAWECHFDFGTPSESFVEQVAWDVKQENADAWSGDPDCGHADICMSDSKTAFIPGTGDLIAPSLDGSELLITKAWAKLGQSCVWKTIRRLHGQDARQGDRIQTVHIADSGNNFLPRLFVISNKAIWISDAQELLRQTHFLGLVGLRVHMLSEGVPLDLWLGRIVPFVLPGLR